MKLFIVSSGTRHVLINIPDALIGDEREYVKRESRRFLFGNADHYVVSPLTNHNDAVFLDLAIGFIGRYSDGQLRPQFPVSEETAD